MDMFETVESLIADVAEGLKIRGFFGHRGRKGKVGGSLPKKKGGGASGGASEKKAPPGGAEVGKLAEKHGFIIHQNSYIKNNHKTRVTATVTPSPSGKTFGVKTHVGTSIRPSLDTSVNSAEKAFQLANEKLSLGGFDY